MSLVRSALSSKLLLLSLGLGVLALLGVLGLGRAQPSDQGIPVAPVPPSLGPMPERPPPADGPTPGRPSQVGGLAPGEGAVGAIPETEVVNLTHGAVDDAVARQWAGAYLASVRGSVEAVERQDEELLRQLYTGAPDAQTLTLIFNTRSAGGVLSYAPGHDPHVTRLMLIVLSADQRAAIAASVGPIAGPYAWVVTYQGPIDLTVGWPGGRVQSYPVLPDRRRITELSAGGNVDVPPLGRVWREAFSRDCTAHPDAVLCPY